MRKRSLGLVLGMLALYFIGLHLCVSPARADSILRGTYFALPGRLAPLPHPDVNVGIDGLVITGLVESTLSPNGLPVVSHFGKTRTGGSGHIHDYNAASELLWWSTASPHWVAREKTQNDTLPFNFSGFYPYGATDNATWFRAVQWEGYFNLLAPQSITFSLAADDDAWLFVDGQLVVDNGGVKWLAYTSSATSNFSAGTHSVHLFYIDRHEVDAAIAFRSSVDLAPIPEPGMLVLFGSGLVGVAAACRRKLRA